MEREVKQRLKWVKLYEETRSFSYVSRYYGVTDKVVRKWWHRYRADGIDGLQSRSRRPKNSPGRKVFPEQEQLILKLRAERKLGGRRLQNELFRLYGLHLSTSTIHKVLHKHRVPRLRAGRPAYKRPRRYERPVPGDRIQMDTTKIRSGVYQYTAIDDCTRFQVAALFDRRTAKQTLAFLTQVIDQMPFPIQHVQTDRGTEFTAIDVQEAFMTHRIKWRPNRARSPHLNGKVERVQKTAKDEFYATIDIQQPLDQLQEQLQGYQDYYNWVRKHGSLGTTPGQRFTQRQPIIPSLDTVYTDFDASSEYERILRFRSQYTVL